MKWSEEILKVHLWSKQREIIHSVFNNRRTVVRACFNVGKTFIGAVSALAFLYTEIPSIVLTTAPTWTQVKNILWREINDLYKTKLTSEGYGFGKPLTTGLNLDERWFAIGLSPKEEVNIQGFHQKNILIIVDECPGVRKEIIDGLDGLMSNENAHLLYIGNPLVGGGHFYDAFTSPLFSKFHISAFDSPNFTNEDVPQELKEKLVSKQWVDEKRVEWGEDNPLWFSRVLGEFPIKGERQLISLYECEQAKEREIIGNEGDRTFLAIDVARYGIDKTVFTVADGLEIREIIEMQKQSLTETIGQAKVIYESFNVDEIRVDEIGIGAGVVDQLEEDGLPVIGINTAKRNGLINPKSHFNLRTELWFHFKDWLSKGKLPNHDKLIRDLVTPQYSYKSDGTYFIEPKEEIIKRLGRSPDYGDSAVMSTPQIISADSLPKPKPLIQSSTMSQTDFMSKAGLI